MKPGKTAPRWTKDDWTALGLKALREHGPQGVTVEALCAAAGRTRGSFYHHFETMDAFLIAMAESWRAQGTDALIQKSLAEPDPNARRKQLNRMANALDHDLEVNIRLLAAQYPPVAKIVEETDAARLFHSLHLAAQIRAPKGAGEFVKPASAFLDGLLRGRTVS